MTRLNVYGMYSQNGNAAGFWVRRNSWAKSTFAQVTSVAGKAAGPIEGDPPYYERQSVRMDFYKDGQLLERNAELSCPGTYAYELIADPRAKSEEVGK